MTIMTKVIFSKKTLSPKKLSELKNDEPYFYFPNTSQEYNWCYVKNMDCLELRLNMGDFNIGFDSSKTVYPATFEHIKTIISSEAVYSNHIGCGETFIAEKSPDILLRTTIDIEQDFFLVFNLTKCKFDACSYFDRFYLCSTFITL